MRAGRQPMTNKNTGAPTSNDQWKVTNRHPMRVTAVTAGLR